MTAKSRTGIGHNRRDFAQNRYITHTANVCLYYGNRTVRLHMNSHRVCRCCLFLTNTRQILMWRGQIRYTFTSIRYTQTKHFASALTTKVVVASRTQRFISLPNNSQHFSDRRFSGYAVHFDLQPNRISSDCEVAKVDKNPYLEKK